MTRIAPMRVEDLPNKTREALEYAQGIMGFAPNDVLTMAHWPELLEAMERLVQVIYKPGELDPVLKRMIATVTSGAAGCRYCQAHTAHGAVQMAGGDEEKIAAVWDFHISDLFSDAERAALNLALAAGSQPNDATDEHFRALEKHFSQRQIMEIMGVIGLFGFLNRWNDTLATELEDKPMAFASETYPSATWDAGKHAND
ncbi:carboxymuconolactone decarboxylase family protein [Erythrobacter sp. YT30]|uniref:carboxymuconolactone decarboxylase family protein n=1 Tax=Erythrobacter sp. YT30 TaxID=1735012 RepID=UPI00076D0F6D|nr:carboxymuconolactone decarboxylase family protein [Erythrobacter sp. YT30]KWV90767.1 carboxymuconolactone decarboxylase [Erythrobacter sp. YT30]